MRNQNSWRNFHLHNTTDTTKHKEQEKLVVYIEFPMLPKDLHQRYVKTKSQAVFVAELANGLS